MLDLGGCKIRPMVNADLEQVLAWRNHPDVREYMLTRHEISAQEHQQWFQRASADATRRLLLVEDEMATLGFVSFSDVCPGGVSEWGFYAAPDAPRGSGKKLGVVALDLAFGDLALHKVCGQAMAFNASSIRFHESLGFAREGVLRDQQRIGLAYHDMVCFGLLSSEWMNARHSMIGGA